jgi:creatinine amidohydrolase
MGHFISELTYEELYPLLNEKSIVVLPVGGGSKEHGAHLPMGTDMYVTEWIARKVTERCDVLTLPNVPYAYFPAFVGWKGSVSVEHAHFTAYVHDVISSIARFGVKKFVIIDGGVSTHGPLCTLARDMYNELGILAGVTDIRELAREIEEKVCRQPKGGHGDESETSCMLHIRPDLVHMDRAAEEYTHGYSLIGPGGRIKVSVPCPMNTPHGINGNSRLATEAKGAVILETMVSSICEFITNFTACREEDTHDDARK